MSEPIHRKPDSFQIRYDMENGGFHAPRSSSPSSWLQDTVSCGNQVDGGGGGGGNVKNMLSEVYQIKTDPELVLHIGVLPGSKASWLLIGCVIIILRRKANRYLRASMHLKARITCTPRLKVTL